MSKVPYECIRCNYSTSHKPSMRNHLYKAKKVCPASHNDIELTDEIKDYILANRRYHIQETKHISLSINNFINTLDHLSKLEKYCSYKDINLITFEDQVCNTFSKKCAELDNYNNIKFSLSQDQLIESVDQVTKACSIEENNIYYDTKIDKIKVYETFKNKHRIIENKWTELMVSVGIGQIFNTIQQQFWNIYERYLVRKWNSSKSAYEKQELLDNIKIYYSFLACMNMTPYVLKKNNSEILYNLDDDKYNVYSDDFNLEEKFMKVFFDIRENLPKTNKMKSDILKLMRGNSKRDEYELNNTLMKVLKIDNDLKIALLK